MIKVYLFILLNFILINTHSQSISIFHNNYPEQRSGAPYVPPGEYSYGQAIYLENEIQGVGAITGLTFYYNGTSLSNSDSLTVYIGITDIDHFDSIRAFKTTMMTNVFQGKLQNYTVPGTITIPLTISFNYTGTGNLVVAVNETKPGFDTSYFTGYGITFGRYGRGFAWANITPWILSVFDQTPGAYPTTGGVECQKLLFKVLLHYLVSHLKMFDSVILTTLQQN